MAEKQLYRTVIKLEVLSEEPIQDGITLSSIVYECENGVLSGLTNFKVVNEPIVGKAAAKRLTKHGSDPEFFNMDKNGNELDKDFWDFVSVWEDGTQIKTNATYNEETGQIIAETSNDEDDHGCLLDEFIVPQHGKLLQVCPECHSYALRTENNCLFCPDTECDFN